MGYVALKPVKAQLGTERKITVVQPGQKVPGAETWRNIKALVARGYVSYVDDGVAPVVKLKAQPQVVAAPAPLVGSEEDDEDHFQESAPDESHEAPKKTAKKPDEPKKAHHTHKSRR